MLSALFSGCSFWTEEGLSEILEASDPSTEHPEDLPERKSDFTLAYYTGEPLDPYTSKSRTNAELLRLCYSGLFSLDALYDPVPVLAESWEVQGNSVLIRLRDGLCFSDGSPVTAADCVHSYRTASKSDSVYAGIFSSIRSYAAVDERIFRVDFVFYTPTQLNLLTVPIVKREGVDSAGYPLGCGRYSFSQGDPLVLEHCNCGCWPGDYSLSRIALLGVPDEESLIYYFNYGRLQAVYANLSEGAEEYRSDNEVVTHVSNRFTFLAVNRSKPALANVNFSKALTYLIDRTELTGSALHSYAAGVWYPLNPSWSKTVQADLNPEITSPADASSAFDAAGWTLNGTVRRWRGNADPLRILVNRENASRTAAAEWIAQTLQGAGIAAEVEALSWKEYSSAIQKREFDLYLGEMLLPVNMDLTALFSEEICGSGAADGTYDALRALADGVLAGTEAVRTFVSEFQNVLPFIPLYYSREALAVSMQVQGEFGSSVTEIYAGIENWTFEGN